MVLIQNCNQTKRKNNSLETILLCIQSNKPKIIEKILYNHSTLLKYFLAIIAYRTLTMTIIIHLIKFSRHTISMLEIQQLILARNH